MKMTVIGLGYLGVTHAIAMAKIGHRVYGIDPDANKVALLSAGVVPFYEPDLNEELLSVMELGRISFSTVHTEGSGEADLHWICVGTPQADESGKANTEYLESAVKDVVKIAKPGSIIVGKSTVPVGTHKELLDIIQSEKDNIRLAWNPEFLREGTALADSLNPDRIVIGDSNDGCYQVIVEAYDAIIKESTPIIHTNLPTAELVKVASNSFLATKISFINAIAEISELTGADVRQVAESMGHDERIGNKFLRAGIGFGGGCLPKDIRAFRARAEELGLSDSFTFLDEVDIINSRSRARVINSVRNKLGTVKGKIVSVLGAAFKPNSDDIRESPALDIALELLKLGAQVKIHDPKANNHVRALGTELLVFDDVYDVFIESDIILHLTEWHEYQELDIKRVAGLVSQRSIIDGRLALKSSEWLSHGFTVSYLGVGQSEL